MTIPKARRAYASGLKSAGRVKPRPVPSAKWRELIADRVIEPWLDDPFPDYDTEPVLAYAKA